MATPTETERYIRFQLEQIGARNEHHLFEELCLHIAERRISSNIIPATGPVSSGGDQARDAESYYTALPLEVPGAGGFIGRATTQPIVLACTTQKDRIEGKIREDLETICHTGQPVARVAYFSVQELAVAKRHKLQEHAKDSYGVELEIFDGRAVSFLLAQRDLTWIAQRFLELPSNLLPEPEPDTHPEWYVKTLDAVRGRTDSQLTHGAFSELRDCLRFATFDSEARADLPEWLRYTREFFGEQVGRDLQFFARYEYIVAFLRGLDRIVDVEDEVSHAIDFAIESDSPATIQDASVLFSYWSSAWWRRLATVGINRLDDARERIAIRLRELLANTDGSTHPVRRARLLDTSAFLCLIPRWSEVERPPLGTTLVTPSQATAYRLSREAAGEPILLDTDPSLIDAPGAIAYFTEFASLISGTPAYPIIQTARVFQMSTLALCQEPGYEDVRDAFDTVVADAEGDQAIGDRCRQRAFAFYRSGNLRPALREFHNAKIRWWRGDTMRGSLISMELIGRIYAQLGMTYAAKQYALAAAFVALSSEDADLQDIIPQALIEAVSHCYKSGNWGDAIGMAHAAILAHHRFAENAFDFEQHPDLHGIDFHVMTALLAAERFRPTSLPAVKLLLGRTGYEEVLNEILQEVRSTFYHDESALVTACDEQIFGRPFSDIGANRSLKFAALDVTWVIECSNDRANVLAAERLTAALQVMLVEFSQFDPVFLKQTIDINVEVGTPFRRERVEFTENPCGVSCSVLLSPANPDAEPTLQNHETSFVATILLTHLTVRPTQEFLAELERVLADGLLSKIHIARPYDEIAGVLTDDHYESLRSISVKPFGTGPYMPRQVEDLGSVRGPGPSYNHEKSLSQIRQSYEDLPNLIRFTLPRALKNRRTLRDLYRLRADGWPDWHILLAIVNVAFNMRLQVLLASSPGVLQDRTRLIELAHQAEKSPSESVSPEEITASSLRQVMETVMFAVAERRWNIHSPLPTPNVAAFRELLEARYNFSSDDVPHLDLLAHGLRADGSIASLAIE